MMTKNTERQAREDTYLQSPDNIQGIPKVWDIVKVKLDFLCSLSASKQSILTVNFLGRINKIVYFFL